MQAVLSIDLTTEPARAEVVEVEGRFVRVCERHSLLLNGALAESVDGNENLLVEGSSALPSQSSVSQSLEPTKATGASLPDSLSSPILQLIQKITVPWTTAIVIVPANEYISLNIELPFRDEKQINKILPLEVQDKIPFPVDEFLLEHRLLGEYTSPETPTAGGNDIHVTLLPKKFLRKVLSLCKDGNIEPLVVSTPSAVIGAALYVAPDFFPKDVGFVVERPDSWYLALAHEGALKADRVIIKSPPSSSEELGTSPSREALTSMRLTIAGFEQRYGKTLEKIYHVGTSLTSEELQQYLGRPIALLSLQDLIKESDETVSTDRGDGLATLGAVFTQDIDPPTILTNFRVNEFSYSPRLDEVTRGLKELLPYLFGALLITALTLAGIYYARARYISQVRQALTAEIRNAMPNAEVPEAYPVEALRGQVRLLEEQLKDLGTLSQLSPLDTLAELTRDIGEVTKALPPEKKIAIRTISIKSSNRIKVEGTTSDYGAPEELERALRAKKYRAKADAKDLVPGTNEREFTLDIVPKE